jgi:hypothetical protein
MFSSAPCSQVDIQNSNFIGWFVSLLNAFPYSGGSIFLMKVPSEVLGPVAGELVTADTFYKAYGYQDLRLIVSHNFVGLYGY